MRCRLTSRPSLLSLHQSLPRLAQSILLLYLLLDLAMPRPCRCGSTYLREQVLATLLGLQLQFTRDPLPIKPHRRDLVVRWYRRQGMHVLTPPRAPPPGVREGGGGEEEEEGGEEEQGGREEGRSKWRSHGLPCVCLVGWGKREWRGEGWVRLWHSHCPSGTRAHNNREQSTYGKRAVALIQKCLCCCLCFFKSLAFGGLGIKT